MQLNDLLILGSPFIDDENTILLFPIKYLESAFSIHRIISYSPSYTFRDFHVREFSYLNESSASKSLLQEYTFLEKSPKWWHSLTYFM